MELEVIKTCPLGSTCREIKDNKIYECRWLTKLKGIDAQGQEVDNEECALYWMPILSIEASTTNRSIASSIDSARNTTVDNTNKAILLAKNIGLT